MAINPVLVQSTRNGTLESFHRGVVCVVGASGEVVYSAGDVQQICFPRSAIKYMQVLPLLESGAADHFQITAAEIALICASHNGEPEHVEGVKKLLQRTGIDTGELGCGAHAPYHGESYAQLLMSGNRPTELHNNCSGKHTGFLILARYMGVPTEGYLNPDHPVQVLVREALADLCEMKAEHFLAGTDGCSAPNYAMPVINQATGFRNLGMPRGNARRDQACRRVLQSIAEHPQMVAGTGRYCTELIRETGGKIIGKLGAEGVYCMSVPEKKLGIAIKVDDGSTGPQYNVAQAVLVKLGLISGDTSDKMKRWLSTPILNFKKNQTGSREVTPELLNP